MTNKNGKYKYFNHIEKRIIDKDKSVRNFVGKSHDSNPMC